MDTAQVGGVVGLSWILLRLVRWGSGVVMDTAQVGGVVMDTAQVGGVVMNTAQVGRVV